VEGSLDRDELSPISRTTSVLTLIRVRRQVTVCRRLRTRRIAPGFCGNFRQSHRARASKLATVLACVDLGQSRDPTAIAVVRRVEIETDETATTAADIHRTAAGSAL
jgi:hypothetical protein